VATFNQKEDRSDPCDCRWLIEAAEDLRFPVFYDEQDNQFKLICQLENGGTGYTSFYFCPMCGGRAPDLRKQALFEQVTAQELTRLQALTQDIQSIEDALRILGKPELDAEPRTGREPGRVLTYHKVSETAVVHITASADGTVRIVFQEKYIGSRASA
jgi:hypothetical protein